MLCPTTNAAPTQGCDPMASTHDGQSPLDVAIAGKHDAVVETLHQLQQYNSRRVMLAIVLCIAHDEVKVNANLPG